MKTLNLQLAIIFIFTLACKAEIYASKSQLVPDEKEFKMNFVWNNFSLINKTDFNGAEYNQEILIDAKCNTADCQYEKAISEVFNLPDESFVDDIPFNTGQVADRAILKSTSDRIFDFEDEVFINDIPFDTKEVVTFFQIRNNLAVR